MRRCTALAAVILLLATAMAPVAAHGGHSGPSFVVDLNRDGSATVTLTLTYDLETGEERTAFRTLQNDSDARADARERFRTRMASVASDASTATGRDMTVKNATIDLSVTDDESVGVAELSVTWTGLAATTDGTLVVTEPFASGFEPERPFTIRGPEGYRLDSATPQPDSTDTNEATWEPGTDLSGFAVTFEPTSGDGSTGGGTDDGILGGVSAPGFGAGLAVGAILAVGFGLSRRRH